MCLTPPLCPKLVYHYKRWVCPIVPWIIQVSLNFLDVHMTASFSDSWQSYSLHTFVYLKIFPCRPKIHAISVRNTYLGTNEGWSGCFNTRRLFFLLTVFLSFIHALGFVQTYLRCRFALFVIRRVTFFQNSTHLFLIQPVSRTFLEYFSKKNERLSFIIFHSLS